MRMRKSGAILLCLTYLISCALFFHLGRTSSSSSSSSSMTTTDRVGNESRITGGTTSNDNNDNINNNKGTRGRHRADDDSSSSSIVLLDDVVERILARSSLGRRRDDDEDDDDVALVMRRIRLLNDCSSSPDCLDSLAGGGVSREEEDDDPDADADSPLPLLPMPVLITAYYAGQGIGRMIEHTTGTCLNAASVGRGCLVDSTSRHRGTPNRDSWYTFRSFVRVVVDVDVDDISLRYRRDETNDDARDESRRDSRGGTASRQRRLRRPLLLLSRETVDEARRAISLLSNFAAGHWTADDIGNERFARVLPLGDENVTTDGVVRTIIDNPRKLVLSPNWGTSWFARRDVIWPPLLPTPTTTTTKTDDEYDRRSRSRLESYVQNYMYRPTPLLRGLHEEYKRIVLGGVRGGGGDVNEDENENADEDYDDGDAVNSYGAVHLRLFFVGQKHRGDPPGYDRALRDLGTNLHDCMRYWQDVDAVDRWWVIADDLEGGMNITLRIREEASRWEGRRTGGGPRRKMEVFAEDGQADDDDDHDAPASALVGDRAARAAMRRILLSRRTIGRGHSNSEAARGPMGHEAMADSLVDWMVLHESKIAIVTNGSFGASGAKGNGKFLGGSPVVVPSGTNDGAEGGTSGSCEGLRVFRM